MLLFILLLPAMVSSMTYPCNVGRFQVQQNFDLARFQGRWFFWKQFSQGNFLNQNHLTNREHIYTGDGAGNLDVLSVARARSGKCRYSKGKLSESVPGVATAKLVYQSSMLLNNLINYWVIETDYDNYAVIYGCNRLSRSGTCTQAYSFILVRDVKTPPTQEQINKINQAITRVCLVPSSVVMVTRSMKGCRQCDQDTWTVQPNFDVNQFLGTWYEMVVKPREFFPPELAFGNYLNIYSLLPDGNVGVADHGRNPSNNNECFMNAPLEFVRLETTSVPGKLLIYDGPDDLVADDYWVIETDYTGYALVLGCVREATTPAGQCEGFRGWVWSRNPYLTSLSFVRVKKLFDQFCLNIHDFFITSQDNPCPNPQNAPSGKVQVCVKYDKADVQITGW